LRECRERGERVNLEKERVRDKEKKERKKERVEVG